MNSSSEELAHGTARDVSDERRPRRGGRRPGDSGTREAVLAAAQRQFSKLGYDRTTMRSIATEAGVDQKLVGYFFGSKQALLGYGQDKPQRCSRPGAS
jgi:hypothetical protein